VIAPSIFERSSHLGRPRSVRAATQRRLGRKSRARYAGVTRVSAALSCVLFLLMIYVLLTSSLTGLSYAVAKAQTQREALQEETMRLDDRIAALRSDDRLAALAARLGMRDPQQFAVVRVEPPRVARAGPRFPMLSSLAGFFAPAVTRKQQ
jgi:cell division protein FtsB